MPALQILAEEASTPWRIIIANDTCPDVTWGFTEAQVRQAFADLIAAHLDEMTRTDMLAPEEVNWKNKLLALLHDPPSKIVDLSDHDVHADTLLRQAGFTDEQERRALIESRFRSDADQTASAADRFPFPYYATAKIVALLMECATNSTTLWAVLHCLSIAPSSQPKLLANGARSSEPNCCGGP
jgi:hypothetical protein